MRPDDLLPGENPRGGSFTPADEAYLNSIGRPTAAMTAAEELRARLEAEQATPKAPNTFTIVTEHEAGEGLSDADPIFRNLTRYGHAALLDAIALTIETHTAGRDGTMIAAAHLLRISAAHSRA